jgi:hypothetical protein
VTLARLIIAIVIPVFALGIVLMNWWCVIINRRNKKRGIERHYSTIPLVSLPLAALAYLIFPRPNRGWIFVFPLLDIANWRLLWLPLALLRDKRRKQSSKSSR